MNFKPMRMFGSSKYKGCENYINSQRLYEILRTIIYFTISISLFVAGYIATETRLNLLTVVAVVGCLPGCKSLIGVIMFLRYKSCSSEVCEQIHAVDYDIQELYDMVFTSYEKNYSVGHLVIAGNTVCGFTEDNKFDENAFQAHILNILKMDGHKNVSVKIFTDLNKYLERIDQLNQLERDVDTSMAIAETLKSVAL